MGDVNKVRIDLTGAPQTMLATLYAKALDADADHPILNDPFAKDLVGRIQYDWRETTITARSAPLITARSAHFDRWVRHFLSEHKQAIVLHVGCGLDSRAFRLNPSPEVEWYDIDFPDVISLRKKLYPIRKNYHLVPASATEHMWIGEFTADRPVLFIAEGVTMYLTKDDGIALLRRVVKQFPSGELHFDVFNRFAIRSQALNGGVRRSGSVLRWAVNTPDEILRAVPGVQLVSAVSLYDAETFREAPTLNRVGGRIMARLPVLRNVHQFHRYTF